MQLIGSSFPCYGNQIPSSIIPKTLHRISCLVNVLSKGFWINVDPFKPIADLIFVLDSQRPLAQITTLGDLGLCVVSIAFVFGVPWVYRVGNESPVVAHKRVKMFEKPRKSVQILHDADIENHEYRVEWFRIGVEYVSSLGVFATAPRHDLHSFRRDVDRDYVKSSVLNGQRMRSGACAQVEYFPGAKLYRDPIERR